MERNKSHTITDHQQCSQRTSILMSINFPPSTVLIIVIIVIVSICIVVLIFRIVVVIFLITVSIIPRILQLQQ